MAGDNGKSGSPVNPFEDMSFSKEKKEVTDKKSGKKEMWSKIEKGVSESKRDDLKGWIGEGEDKVPKKRRRRPRRKAKTLQSLDVKQEDNKPEVVKEASAADPVNPFVEMAKHPAPVQEELVQKEEKFSGIPEPSIVSEPPVVPETPPEPDPFKLYEDKELPPVAYEDRYTNDDIGKDTGDEISNFVKEEPVDVVDNVDASSINPFAPVSSDESIVDVKALDDKPLDQRSDGIDVSKNESHEHDPEEIDQSNEQMNSDGESDFSESGDIASEPVDLSTGHVSEVVEVDAGDISSETPILDPTETQIKEESSNISEVDEFKEEFWDILEQAGFTKKRLIIIIVVFVLGVFVLIGWGSGWFDFSSSDKEIVENIEGDEVVEVKDPIEENFDVIPFESSYVVDDQSVSLEMVKEGALLYRGGIAGVEVAFTLGGIDRSFEQQIVYYVELIRRMESMYATDVYALIDRAVDRRGALIRHLEEMDSLINEGNSAYNAIVAAMNRFDAEFEVIANSKFVYEEQFFSNVSDLLPSSSYNSFETFVELSKEGVELKAYFNSYKLFRDMVSNSLNVLEPRYRDINANIEALIKGIRVFDVPRSDIEAIIPI